MQITRRWGRAAVVMGGTSLVAGTFLTTVEMPGAPWPGSSGGTHAESLSNFALEHPEVALLHRHLPLAFLREKLENGGELVSGPAQEQYDDRAYPRTTIADAQRRGAAAAFHRLAKDGSGGSTGGSTTSTTLTIPQSLDGYATVGGAWLPLGPATNTVPGPVTYTGVPTTNSGRATAIVALPGCTDGEGNCTVFVGTAGGGVWRTADGLTENPAWTPVSDGAQGIPSGAIGSLYYDAAHDTLYAGTGEPNGSGDSEAGVGLYRTSDGGATWSMVGDSNLVARDRSVGAIVVAPDGTVYMGTDLARHGSSSVNGGRRTPPDAAPLGLYQLPTGTSKFSLIGQWPASAVDPGAGTGTDYFQGGVNHLELDPNDPRTIYAAVFGFGIWRSSPRLDHTAAFKQVFATFNPRDLYGDRTEFALTTKNGHTRIYAGDSSDSKEMSFLWRTDNADVPASALSASSGNNGWIKLSNPGNGEPGFDSYNFCEGQCGYDMFVASPTGHPDTVYLGGSMNYDEIFGTVPPRSNGRAVLRSVDAGRSFTDMTNDSSDVGMHPDQHAIAFVPNADGTVNQDRFFETSDGGVIRVDQAGAVNASAECAGRHLLGYDLLDCQRWLSAIPQRIVSLNRSLQTLQFQSISTYPSDGGTGYLGGTQDNGTWAFDGAENGFETVGGDGGQSATDSGDSDVHFHTYYSSFLDVNHGLDPNHWNYISQPQDSSGEAASFYVPLVADQNRPHTLYEGLQHVWRTTDNGGDWAFLDANCSETDPTRYNPAAMCGDFTPIGPDLTSPAFGDRAGQYVVAIAVAPSDSDVMWVATRTGRLFVSTNAAAENPKDVTFTRVDSPDKGRTQLLPNRFISGIAVDPADPMHAFVSYSGYSAYAAGGHVYAVTFDPDTAHASAMDLSGDLGDLPVTGIVYDGGTLYLSTDFGVLTTSDANRAPVGSTAVTWSIAGTGLPPVTVFGLTLADGRLIAATHGRGAWVLPRSGP
ncbi:MAG TPA: hypothetical protein VFT62_08690 [Mycobacteriales bacterium]|nr:hypothetical protein [Mycobacteriales bacterium]